MSARSCEVNLKLKTLALSAKCSDTPSRVPNRIRTLILPRMHVLDIPTNTAPTKGWSRTQRVATLAMLFPPCLSPIARSTLNSDWSSSHVPHDIKMTSRYYRTKLRIAESSDKGCLPCVGMVSMDFPHHMDRGGVFRATCQSKNFRTVIDWMSLSRKMWWQAD